MHPRPTERNFSFGACAALFLIPAWGRRSAGQRPGSLAALPEVLGAHRRLALASLLVARCRQSVGEFQLQLAGLGLQRRSFLLAAPEAMLPEALKALLLAALEALFPEALEALLPVALLTLVADLMLSAVRWQLSAARLVEVSIF